MSYCDSDLKKYYANIDQFDLKKTFTDEWVVHSGNVDKYPDSGSVSKLYRNGDDLGEAQASIAAISADGNWYYDSASDTLYCQNTNNADTYEFQVSPLSWSDAKTAAISDAAEWLESELDNRFPRPIPRNSNGSFDWAIKRLNGLLACVILIRSTDPGNAVLESIISEVTNPEKTGLLDRLNAGQIKLSFEITRDGYWLADGATDSDTTGYITDLNGLPTVNYDKYKIEITVGGTLATGAENETIKYKVTDSQGDEIFSADFIDGYYQPMGGGIVGRFMPGVYVAGDYWWLTVSGRASTTSTIGKMRVDRL